MRLWIKTIVGALLALAVMTFVIGAYVANALSQVYPERFGAGVITGGEALAAASSANTLEAYLNDFDFQQTWATCGPASLKNALQSLGFEIATERELFRAGVGSWWKTLATGMTLDELRQLAEANFAGEVELVRAASLEEFRNWLAEANVQENRVIVNFNRAPIHGVNLGHFSPIGGYNTNTGIVTLLDVTERYGFALLPDVLLFEGVSTVDSMSGKLRGLLILRASPEVGQSHARR